MPSVARTRQASIALPPVGVFCQEASPASHKTYIPCSKPAIRIVTTKDRKSTPGETYFMCGLCAGNNVDRRGFRYILQGEKYLITPTPSALEALKASNGMTDNTTKYEDHPSMPQSPKRKAPASASGKGKRNTDAPAQIVGDEEFEQIAPPEDKLDLIRTLGEAQVNLKAKIADKEAELAALYGDLKANSETLLPNAMTDAGMESFTLLDGSHIKVSDFVSASIPKHLKDAGFDWLMDHEGGHLIKRTVTINVGKDDAYKMLLIQVAAFLKKLNKGRKHPIEHETKMMVHGNSLTAWVKERDEAGDPVDDKLLGVFRIKKAEVGKPATKKKDLSIPMED